MSDDVHQILSPIQRRLISVALVVLALNLIGAFLFGVFLLLRLAVLYFANIIWPLAVAGILALLLKPILNWSEKYLKVNRIGSIGLLYGLIIIFCLLMTAWVIPVIIFEAEAFIQYLPTLIDEIMVLLKNFFPDVIIWMQEALKVDALYGYLKMLAIHYQEILEASMPAFGVVGEYVFRTFTLVAGIVIIPVYLFFFLLADHNPLKMLDEEISFIPDRIRKDIIFLIEEFSQIMVGFFRGQILIGIIMGSLFAILFSLVKLKYGVFLGISIGLLNIIPYLGSMIGLLIILPLSYMQQGDGPLLLVLVLGIFVFVQLLEGYFLTPRIMKEKMGLHPLVIIISIFFWGKALNGIMGMIMAIPLTAFFAVAWRLIRKKYLISEMVPETIEEVPTKEPVIN